MDEPGSALIYAGELLQQGKGAEARNLLVGYIKRNPASAQAWWLLSQALADPKQQADCLERVLRLDPSHTLARARLARLRGNAGQPARPPAVSPFHFPGEREAGVSSPPVQPPPATSLFDDPPPEPASLGGRASPPPRPFPAQGRRPPVRKKGPDMLQIAVVTIFVCLGMALLGLLGALALGQKMASDAQATQVMAQAWTMNPPKTLPPTWTPTFTASPRSSPTFTASPLPSQTLPPTNTATAAPRKYGPSAGLYAPDFTLKNAATDAQVSLSGYAGHPVILVFWATWCGYCEREMPSLQAIYNDYKGAGLVVLAVNAGDSASKVRSYRKSHNLTFPILLDPKQDATGRYRVSSIPVNYFIEPSGKIAYVASGMMDYAGLASMVKVIMNAPK
ncbi:MAG: redoxin domain-containing protein [Chloroflexota bacterium]